MPGEKIGTAYVEILSDMSKFNADMKRVQSTTDQTGRSAQKSFNSFGDSVKTTGREVDQLDRAISRLQRTIFAFVGIAVFREIYQGLKKSVTAGIEFNKTLETSKLGIASILSSQYEITNAYKEQLKGAEKINAALQISSKISQQLQIDNLKTAATYEQLVRAFQETLAPGIQAGFDTQKVREFTLAMVQAASAIGLNLDMLAEETRSLLQATITPRTTRIATALGITNPDIRAMMGDSEKLFSFLMGKLEAFSSAGNLVQLTFAGLASNLQDAFKIAAGKGSEGFFNYLKQTMIDLQRAIVSVNEELGVIQVNPKIEGQIEGLTSAFREVVEGVSAFVKGFYEVDKVVPYVSDIDEAFYNLGRDVKGTVDKLSEFGKVFKNDIVDRIAQFYNWIPEEVRENGITGLILFGIVKSMVKYLGPWGAFFTLMAMIIPQIVDKVKELKDVQNQPFDVSDPWASMGMLDDNGDQNKVIENLEKWTEAWNAFFAAIERGDGPIRAFSDGLAKLVDEQDKLDENTKNLQKTLDQHVEALEKGWTVEQLPDISGSFVDMSSSAETTSAQFKILEDVSLDSSSAIYGVANAFNQGATDAGIFHGPLSSLIDELMSLYDISLDVKEALRDLFSIGQDAIIEAQRKLELAGKIGIEKDLIKNTHDYIDSQSKLRESLDKTIEKINKSKDSDKAKALAIEQAQHAYEAAEKAEYDKYKITEKALVIDNNATEARKKHNKSLKEGEKALKAYEKYLESAKDSQEDFNNLISDIKLETLGIGLDDISSSFLDIRIRNEELIESVQDLANAWEKDLNEAAKKSKMSTEEYNSELAKIEENVAKADKEITKLVESMRKLADAQAEVSIADLNKELQELIGTTKDQIDADLRLIDVKLKLIEAQRLQAKEAYNAGNITEAQYNYSEEYNNLQKLILLEQRRYDQLRQTGSLLDGLGYGFQKIGKSMKTSFDIGVELANDLYDAIGEVFDSVIKGERTIREAFEDMADAILAAIAKIAAQQIIIPVVFEMSGLSGLLGMGGSSGSAATAAAVGATTSGSSLSNLLGFGSLFKLSDSVSSILNYGLFDYGTTLTKFVNGVESQVGAFTFTIGNAITALGGLTSVAFGITDLMEGDWFSGATSTLGGGLMLASLIPGMQFLAPIGAAMTLLGSLFGGLFGDKEPEMEYDFGPEYGGAWFDSDFDNIDISDAERKSLDDAVRKYLESIQDAFKINLTDIIADAGDTASIELHGDQLEGVTDYAAYFLDKFWELYGEAIFDATSDWDGFAFNTDFLSALGIPPSGLTLEGSMLEEGVFAENITAILGNLYALEQMGVEVGAIMDGLKFGFFEQAGDDVFKEFGEFFEHLQAEGESIADTMARVISTLDIIPDGLQRMAALVAGFDFDVMEGFEAKFAAIGGDEFGEWIVGVIAADVAAGMDDTAIREHIASYGIGEYGQNLASEMAYQMWLGMQEGGMSEEEAYQTLENQLAFASELLMPAIDAGLAAAIENNFDLSKFEEAFIESMETSLVSALTQVAMQKIFEELLVSTFSQFGSLSDLIGQYVARDITATDLTAGFTGIMDQLGPALAEISPIIKELFGVIQSFMSPSSLDDWTEYFDKMATGEETAKEKLDDLWEWYRSTLESIQSSGMTVEDTAAAVVMLDNTFIDLLEDIKSGYYDIIQEIQDDLTFGGDVPQGIQDLRDLEDKYKEYQDALKNSAILVEELAYGEELLVQWRQQQLQQILDSTLSEWSIEEPNEYKQAINDLNDRFNDAVATLKALADAGLDTSGAIDQVTRSYKDQYNAIVNDLIRAIRDLTLEMYSFVLGLQEKIDSLIGTTGASGMAWGAMEDALKMMNSTFAENDFEGAMGYLNQAISYFDTWYSSQANAITTKYQSLIDAADAQRKALEDQYDAEIEAIEDQIDAFDDLKDQIKETYEAQIEAAEEQLKVAEAFANVVDRVHDQIMDMLTSTANPADVFERLAIQQSEVNRLMALWQGSSGEERAEYAQELADALGNLLSIAGEAYPDVAMQGYQDIYDKVLEGLQTIEADAASRSANIEELTQQIVSLNEAMEAELASIEDQQEALRDSIDALRDAEQAALDSIDSGVESLQAAMEAELQALNAEAAAYYAWFQEIGSKIYEKQIEDMNTTLESILSQSLLDQGIDTYEEGMLYYTAESLRVAYEQYALTHESNRIGYELYNMLANINNNIAGVTGFADGGIAWRPQLAMVAENGPEIISPLFNGGSTQEGASGNGVTVKIGNGAIQINATVTNDMDAHRLGKIIRREVMDMSEYDGEFRTNIKHASKSVR